MSMGSTCSNEQTYASYWSMWKNIPRLRDCFPSHIIVAKAHLRYGTEVNIGGGVMKPDPRWSSSFCENLTILALVPDAAPT